MPTDEAEALLAAAGFRRARHDLQQEQLRRLAAHLDLPQLHLPFLFSPALGPSEIDELAAALGKAVGAFEMAS